MFEDRARKVVARGSVFQLPWSLGSRICTGFPISDFRSPTSESPMMLSKGRRSGHLMTVPKTEADA